MNLLINAAERFSAAFLPHFYNKYFLQVQYKKTALRQSFYIYVYAFCDIFKYCYWRFRRGITAIQKIPSTLLENIRCKAVLLHNRKTEREVLLPLPF